MNVSTITMPPELAKEKLRAYRTNRHRQAEEEYSQAEVAYKALAKGTPLIDIGEVFREVARDEKGRPKIAICRADRKEVKFLQPIWSSLGIFSGCDSYQSHESRSLTIQVSMERNTLGNTIEGYALVPMIPADVIPERGQRKDWHILWEVTHWSEKSKHGRPPIDPLLLRHVGGNLYAVLAEWDLTPLEQAIMSGAMRS